MKNQGYDDALKKKKRKKEEELGEVEIRVTRINRRKYVGQRNNRGLCEYINKLASRTGRRSSCRSRAFEISVKK